MILQLPDSVVKFAGRFLSSAPGRLPARLRRALAPIIAGIVLSTGTRRSLTALGGVVFSARRHKSTVSRVLKDRRFKTRELLWKAAERAMRDVAPKDGKAVEWLLALDGTATQRGAHTRIKGAIQCERKPSTKVKRRKRGARRQKGRTDGSSKKRRKTKYHTFLIGSITTHTGVRIPLGRYTCDPKGFNRHGRPRKIRDTQMDLAKLLIERALSILPKNVRLVVVADSYFECEKLFGLAHRRGFVLITPTDSNRCFADETTPNRSNGLRIRDHGLQLSKDSFRRLDLYRGSEKTACYRRHSARKAGPKDRRTYWLHHERRTVAKLGTVGIVYSWKTPVYEPRRTFKKKSFKILLCSDPTWTGERVVEWYECRWTAIEILIRELKGQLGLDHYTGQSLEALERHIDMVLLSLLYLEMERDRLLRSESTTTAIRKSAAVARTHGMKAIVRWESNQAVLAAIRASYRSERTRRRLKRFLREIPSSLDVLPESRAA